MSEPPDDPAKLVDHVAEVMMVALVAVVKEHVPREHRAAVLRHLAQKINLELKVRTFIETARIAAPQQKDD